MLDQEYHSFGPWIYEISEEHPLPPLFRPYYKENKNHLMLVKIPRNIDRKDAKPGMDLYDYVIGMYEDHIYILKRVEKKVEEKKVLYSDIEGLVDQRELLKGTLTIYLKDSKVIVPFNTASSDTIVKLTKIIRDRYTSKTFEEISDICCNKNYNIDTFYSNLLRDMKTNEDDISITAAQASVPVTLKNGSFFDKMVHVITGKILLNTLHLTNNRELIIISRGKSFKTNREANYRYTFTYIPIEKLHSVKFEDNASYDSLTELYLHISEKEFKFYFEKTNKDLMDFYRKLSDFISKFLLAGTA